MIPYWHSFDDIFSVKATLFIISVLLSVLAIMAILICIVRSICQQCGCCPEKEPLNPLIYLKNTDLLKKNLEENFYLSEILSSSADSFSSGGSLVSMRSDSTVSIISQTSSNYQLLPLVNSIVSSCAVHKGRRGSSNPVISLELKLVTTNDNSGQSSKLYVIVKEINHLPTQDYPSYTEAYVTLSILRNNKIRSSSESSTNVIFFGTSRSVRNTHSIALDEHFIIEGKKTDIKKWNLLLNVFNQDMYTEPKELAAIVVPLPGKHYKQLLAKKDGINVSLTMKASNKDYGNLLIGLSYLPTSQRLCVNIVKASNLKYFPTKKSSAADFKFFARLMILTGVTGRLLKDKWLPFEKLPDPFELNGTTSFDVTASQLETITLLILLYSKEFTAEINTFKQSTGGDCKLEICKTEKHENDRYFGCVALGNLVVGIKESKHWKMMLSVPRRVVTVWHTLK